MLLYILYIYISIFNSQLQMIKAIVIASITQKMLNVPLPFA